MKKQEKNKKLIDLTYKFIEDVSKEKEKLPINEQKDAGDLIHVMKSVLYKLGVPKSVKKSKPNSNAFRKKELVQGKGKIENNAPKNAFVRKELKDAVHKDIKNDAPKNAFKRKEITSEQEEKQEAIKKTGDKWNKRLSKEKKDSIKSLLGEGHSIEEISEMLWIEEKTIAKFLGLKVPSVVIADNSTSEADEFIQQVKDSKNG